MYEKKIPLALECGLSITKEVLGGKWKPILVFAIASGIKRPSQLQRAIPKSTKRVLSLQLRELEEFKIVERTIYPQLPPKVEYRLTQMGETLLPILQLMDVWGEKNRKLIEEVVTGRQESQ